MAFDLVKADTAAFATFQAIERAIEHATKEPDDIRRPLLKTLYEARDKIGWVRWWLVHEER